MTSNDRPRGFAAERHAARMLEDRGCRIVATNYRAAPGEIDVIATVENLIIFVEVKERTGERFGRAEEAVDAGKLERILATAEHFIADNPEYAEHIWRIDLIAITLRRDGSIQRRRHIENLIVD